MISKAKFFIFLLTFLVLSCATHSLKVKKSSDLDKGTASKILKETLSGRAQIDSIHLEANVKVDSKRKRFFFRQIMSAKRPGMAHLTTIKFGTPIAHISLNEKGVTVFDPKNGQFFSGEDIEGVLKKFTGIGISLNDFLELVFAGFYFESKIKEAKLINGAYCKILMEDPGSKGKREIWIDSEKKIYVQGTLLQKEAGEQVTVNFNKYKKFNNNLYPTQIRVKREKPFFEILFKIKSVSFKSIDDAKSLELPIPPGTVISPLNLIQGIF